MEERRSLSRAVVLLSFAVVAACEVGDVSQIADLVLTNGKIITVDDALPEAEAVAVVGDRVVAVGTTQEIERYIGTGTEVLDLSGRVAIPGFIEHHGHGRRAGPASAGPGDRRLAG